MAGSEPIDWRAVFALLANAETRSAFAEVIDGRLPSGAANRRALGRLVAAGLAEEGPDGRPIVAEDRLRATLKAVAPAPATGVERFLTREGRIIGYPSRWSDRRELLALVLARTMGPDEHLTEAQLGERLAGFTEDVATLRRYLVDAGLLSRSPDGRSYRLATADETPPTSA